MRTCTKKQKKLPFDLEALIIHESASFKLVAITNIGPYYLQTLLLSINLILSLTKEMSF